MSFLRYKKKWPSGHFIPLSLKTIINSHIFLWGGVYKLLNIFTIPVHNVLYKCQAFRTLPYKKKKKKKKSFSYPVNRNKSVFKKEIDNVVNKLKV